MKLKMVEQWEDWYTIERADHDGRIWLERTGPNSSAIRCSSRFSDADVEGTTEHMLGIAKAIRERGEYSAKRCSVLISDGKAHFCSPRNSRIDGVVSVAEADELADQIEKELG